MNKILTIIVLMVLLSIVVKSQPQKTVKDYLQIRKEAYVSIKLNNKNDFKILDKIVGLDPRGINNNANEINAYVNSKQYADLLKTNYEFEVKTPPSLVKSVDMCVDNNAIANWNCYPTYEQYIYLMNKFASDYPQLCTLHEIGESVDGRKVLVVKISDNVNTDEDEPEFFYTSTMHGDETAGYVLMMRLISYLLDNYSTIDRVTELVDTKEIWINPLANPDGTYAAGNSTVNGATRYNSNSFDLNRNFPDPIFGNYPNGTRQVETQDMMDFMQAHNFILSSNFHGGAEVVNYPWDVKEERHPDDFWYQNISRQYADTVHDNSPAGYMNLYGGITNGFDWYSINGGRQDYVNHFLNSHEVTIELSNIKTPEASELLNLWNYNYRSLLNYINRVHSGIYGKVENKDNNAIAVNINIESIDSDIFNCYSNNYDGMYYRKIESGTYNIVFSAEGYNDFEATDINVLENVQTELNVQLEKSDNTDVDTILENKFKLISYLNPFKDVLDFEFELAEETEIQIFIYNISGKMILDTKSKLYNSGVNTFRINTQSLETGFYVCFFKSSKFNFDMKLIKM